MFVETIPLINKTVLKNIMCRTRLRYRHLKCRNGWNEDIQRAYYQQTNLYEKFIEETIKNINLET